MNSKNFKKLIKKYLGIVQLIIFFAALYFGYVGFHQEYFGSVAAVSETQAETAKAPDTAEASKALVGEPLFKTLLLYAFGYDDVAPNVYINIARYLAAVFSLSIILYICRDGMKTIWFFIVGLHKDSVFIFGDNEEADRIKDSVKHHISGIDYALPIRGKYVLMGTNEENAAFYDDNKKELADKTVYLRSDAVSRVYTNKGRFRYFSLNEIVARQYWEKYSFIDMIDRVPDVENKIDCTIDKGETKTINVAFVGFDTFGEELLFQSIQTNVFGPGYVVNYHLFGKIDEFSNIHDKDNLKALNITCHTSEWYQNIDLLKAMDRIIVCDYKSALSTAQKLLKTVTAVRVDVISYEEIDPELLRDHRFGRIASDVEINTISYLEEGCAWENIIADNTVKMAMDMNWAWTGEDAKKKFGEELYRRFNNKEIKAKANLCKPESVRTAQQETAREEMLKHIAWESLPAELRYSNIASADNKNVRLKLIEKWNKLSGQNYTYDNYAHILDEIEHMRWVNYYLFYNWKHYGDEEKKIYAHDEGKATRSTKYRMHADIVDFKDLSDEEKAKDTIMVSTSLKK